MRSKLKHTHIAVRKSIELLASTIKAPIKDGEDDFGSYNYFELKITHEDSSGQFLRFASHVGDAMVHILAEDINAVSDLAGALFAIGISDVVYLSISTDHKGNPLRNIEEIQERIAAMSIKKQIELLPIVAGRASKANRLGGDADVKSMPELILH